MWELFQKMLNDNITPNQCYLLFSMKEKTQSLHINSKEEVVNLIEKGFVEKQENKSYIITNKGKSLILKYNNYFLKAKKKTNIQLMGKDFADKIEEYRSIFPAGKLPSNVPARQNVKALGESFRWFFETYDYTWEDIIKATKMYVNEYRSDNYMYMVTSQYFIAKQDKHKVKNSKLADYCDMIIDGVESEIHTFKEKIV